MAMVAATDSSGHQREPDGGTWARIDRWCERIGDSLNPILVKETRQALKSRQFVTTFSVLLFAALAWTVVGSLSLMPQIYTSPSASRLLIGYYVVLAIPMLMVVPLAAYRSLEGEIDDGTLELLSITALSPWHIVLGKLASAMLQMVLYYVALFPCVAYAYTLRGVDLPTTLLMMSALLVAAVLLTVVALFFAPLARTRTGRIVTLLAVMVILLGAEWGIGTLVIAMIIYGNPFPAEWVFFFVVATLLISLTLGNLLLTATAAQLTPESENRSTHLRLSMMMLTTAIIALAGFAIQTLGPGAEEILFWFAAALAVLWTMAGAMMAAESPVMTPRIRRELPNSFFARATLTWLTPGPATGLVFATTNVVVIAAMTVFAIQHVYAQPNIFGGRTAISVLTGLTVVYAAYLIGMLIAVRAVMRVIRINNNPRVELGLAALIAVAVLAALVPYSVALHMNDYRSYDYSFWQITNWAWTISLVADGNDMNRHILVIVVVVVMAFFAALLLSPKVVFPRRIATPKRVASELAALK
jgi:ABC-type transport system involved in cytochrome c biogenesis permease component